MKLELVPTSWIQRLLAFFLHIVIVGIQNLAAEHAGQDLADSQGDLVQ